ncbi:hypothetical protein EON77_09165 [bacterium]|nr:MAG: hypothetical protein EON77_09165 [bacterium]
MRQHLADRGEAERVLARAELLAWNARDWDALSRLYMPLQEARRQRRQRCGEGVVKLDCVARNERETIVPEAIVAAFPHGQLLVAGWGTIEPSVSVRRIAAEQNLYVETFLAAAYPAGAPGRFVVAIVPTADVALPPADGRPIDRLAQTLPPFSILIPDTDLVAGERVGSDATFAETMATWETLHAPFLADARHRTDPIQRMSGFRRTIEVDYACELAHQLLSMDARKMLQHA